MVQSFNHALGILNLNKFTTVLVRLYMIVTEELNSHQLIKCSLPFSSPLAAMVMSQLALRRRPSLAAIDRSFAFSEQVLRGERQDKALLQATMQVLRRHMS
ncbi:hypothetical protein BDA96_09G137700 [Sorghum bicolor]|uniref:Uncharacterized protein n=2 Tax=Sorghum bicolor TaxID=4558 RepID=A0A921QBM0_SORBI|nr:hypothetical protein BDA96_09G137700 [Sorghum bicolor]OQU77958.1 hypothetical protein SORBI_3009G130966 [Sorghum bicolor]